MSGIVAWKRPTASATSQRQRDRYSAYTHARNINTMVSKISQIIPRSTAQSIITIDYTYQDIQPAVDAAIILTSNEVSSNDDGDTSGLASSLPSIKGLRT